MTNIDTLKRELAGGEMRALDSFASEVGAEALGEMLENGDWDDAVHEWADSRVSVYTHDRLEWLLENWPTADTAEAIINGARTAEEAAAWCWYEAEFGALDRALTFLHEKRHEGANGVGDLAVSAAAS